MENGKWKMVVGNRKLVMENRKWKVEMEIRE